MSHGAAAWESSVRHIGIPLPDPTTARLTATATVRTVIPDLARALIVRSVARSVAASSPTTVSAVPER
jgi:hypothetical protein